MRVGSNVKSDNFTAYDTPIGDTPIGRCVLAVKLTIDPTLIKCAVKLTLFVQFR